MAVRRVLAFVLACLLGIALGLPVLVGAAFPIGAAQDLQAISHRNRPIELPGISVLPPTGEDWFRFQVAPQERAFGKPVSPDGLVRFVRRLPVAVREQDARQIDAAVLVKFGAERAWTPREFLEAFTGPDPKAEIGHYITHRQRLLDFQARLDDAFGSTCVRYFRLTEIHGQFPSFPELVANTSTEGLYCYHPYWSRYLIDVTYQQTYPQNQTPLAGDADSFLKGVRFTHERPHAADGADSVGQTPSSGATPSNDASGHSTMPTLLNSVEPLYTEAAKKARIEGVVRLRVTVLADGTVSDAHVEKSLDQKYGLDDEAVKAAKQWRFNPGTRAGQPVAAQVSIEITFTLK